MKTIVALPLLILGLSGCQTFVRDIYQPIGFPEPVPVYPVAEGNYRAIGTEPFWDLTIGRDPRLYRSRHELRRGRARSPSAAQCRWRSLLRTPP
jgi:uncharacterized membrane protein